LVMKGPVKRVTSAHIVTSRLVNRRENLMPGFRFASRAGNLHLVILSLVEFGFPHAGSL